MIKLLLLLASVAQAISVGQSSNIPSETITGAGCGSGDTVFSVAGSTLVVKCSGNIGVGLAAPTALLHLSPVNEAGNALKIFRGRDSGYQLDYTQIDMANSGFAYSRFMNQKLSGGNARGFIFVVDTSTAVTIDTTGATTLFVRTKAQINAITPLNIGGQVLCSDCTVPYDLCVATGTTLSGFRATINSAINTATPGTLVAKGCGTNN